jgi:hypothetical protein
MQNPGLLTGNGRHPSKSRAKSEEQNEFGTKTQLRSGNGVGANATPIAGYSRKQ